MQARGVGIEHDEERGAIRDEREQLPRLGTVVVGKLQRAHAAIEAAVLRHDHGVGTRARLRRGRTYEGSDQNDLLHGCTSKVMLCCKTSVRSSGKAPAPAGESLVA